MVYYSFVFQLLFSMPMMVLTIHFGTISVELSHLHLSACKQKKKKKKSIIKLNIEKTKLFVASWKKYTYTQHLHLQPSNTCSLIFTRSWCTRRKTPPDECRAPDPERQDCESDYLL